MTDRRWRGPTVQPVPGDNEWPVESVAVVRAEPRARRNRGGQQVEQRALVRMVRKQQLPDGQEVAAPRSDAYEKCQSAGTRGKTGRLKIQTDQRFVDGHAVGEGRKCAPVDADVEGGFENGDAMVRGADEIRGQGQRVIKPRPWVGRRTARRRAQAIQPSRKDSRFHVERHAQRRLCQLACHAARLLESVAAESATPFSISSRRRATRLAPPFVSTRGPTHAGQPSSQAHPSTSPSAPATSSAWRSYRRAASPTPPGTESYR